MIINRLSDKIHQLATGRRILILLIVYVSMMAVTSALYARVTEISDGVLILDTEYYFTPEVAYERLEDLGASGREVYLEFEFIDLIYPIAYGLFFSAILSYFLQRGFSPESKFQKLNILPLGIMVMDWLQNIGIITLLLNYPKHIDAAAWLSGIATAGIYGITFISGMIAIVAFFLMFKKRLWEPADEEE